jgi:polysaccharide deacetylase family protein (PEP-CTERM system associated)
MPSNRGSNNSESIGESIVNALTVDVEDYFQINAFSKVVRYDDWPKFESRVERNTHRILDILDGRIPGRPDPIRGTFFIVGWVAERFPGLVREIQARGHEAACHGYAHQVIFGQTRDQFREDVKRAKGVLEDITGEQVLGYRAPTYSITRKTLWALDVLHDLGFRYDSSIFPIKHDVYGFPEAPRFMFPFSCKNGNDPATIIEFPITTFRIFNYNLPISGGGYFRLYPYPVTRKLLRSINAGEGQPFIFYLHPWELDHEIPKVSGVGSRSMFRTYVNLHETEGRFQQLLRDFRFAPMKNLVQATGMGARTSE